MRKIYIPQLPVGLSTILSLPVESHIPSRSQLAIMSMASPSTLSARISGNDALTLQRYGRDITEDAVHIIAESIFCAYGIFFAIGLYSILSRKGVRSRGAIIMLSVMVYLYAASMLNWALDLWAFFEGIHSLLMAPGTPIPDRADLADDIASRFYALQEGLFVFNIVIGDSVEIWRTWVIYRGRRLAIIIPSFLLLASFVFGLIDITCSSFQDPTSLPGARDICPPAALIAWAFSLGTNLTCTAFIGLKAWKHRQMMRGLDFPGQPRRMSTEKILSILVESGFIYSLSWAILGIAFLPITRASPWFYPMKILNPLGYQIAGMYATLIIVIVNFKCTIWEDSPTTLSNGAAHNLSQWVVANAKASGATDTFDTQPGFGLTSKP
ncbi:hypothetical protein K438DRAFT_695351 [Mycena galopus ATCC 62051]|nr:hypothetical protein K438DRAFT_695351 [Mycena galopus ATCC 62051]